MIEQYNNRLPFSVRICNFSVLSIYYLFFLLLFITIIYLIKFNDNVYLLFCAFCRSVIMSQPQMKCKRVFQALINIAIEELCETADALIAPVRMGIARPTAPFSLISSNVDAIQVREPCLLYMYLCFFLRLDILLIGLTPVSITSYFYRMRVKKQVASGHALWAAKL